MAHAVDWADIDQLVALIEGVEGIKSVDVELAKVKTPGVFVSVAGYTFDRHRGHTINARLFLLVGDKNPINAAKALGELLNRVLTVLTPSGPVTARTVVTPHAPGGLPGLIFPLDVVTVPS